jgi:hypothetical protein
MKKKETRKVREQFIKDRSWCEELSTQIRRHGSVISGLVAYAHSLERQIAVLRKRMPSEERIDHVQDVEETPVERRGTSVGT